MLDRFYARVYLRGYFFRIDQEGVPRRDCRALVLHGRPVLSRDLCVWIGEQSEGKAFLGTEILVRLRAVYADAENHHAGLLVFREVALEVPCLERAPAREIFRVKIKHDPFAAII